MKNRVFKINSSIKCEQINFKNHFGISLVGDLYYPANYNSSKKYPALSICGPFGAVKEQSSGLYAQEMAARGFIALAFDPSFTGESGGEPRAMHSPDICIEDYQASIDYLSCREDVNPKKLGIIGICGWGGMAINAAALDTRIKSTVVITMYDMSRIAGNGYFDSENNENSRHKSRTAINQQRTEDYKAGTYKKAGGVIDPLPKDSPQFLIDYHNYYKTPRGFHENSPNSTDGWNITANTSLMNTRLLYYANEIDTPVLIIHGEKAHSRYMGESAFDIITNHKFKTSKKPEPYTGEAPLGSTKIGNKELLIVESASHVDLYDNLEKIPFNKIEAFIKESFRS